MITNNKEHLCDEKERWNLKLEKKLREGDIENITHAKMWMGKRYEEDVDRWVALDSNWKDWDLFQSKKVNTLREEQSTAEKIIDVETCKAFCDETPICQYFFITKDGRCILYQSCKVRFQPPGDSGLSNTGNIFEKGIR